MHISTKCSIAIHCLICIHEFGDKKRVTSELLALSTGCNPVTVRNIISALKKDGILSVKSGTGGTSLNCPLEDITLYRVYMAVEPNALKKFIGIHGMPSPLCPVGKKYPRCPGNALWKDAGFSESLPAIDYNGGNCKRVSSYR